MNTALLDDFRDYWPHIYNDMEEFWEMSPWELTIRRYNGEMYIFDNRDNSIRALPKDSNNLAELEFRLEFSWRLRKLLWFRGITQKELADMIGVSAMSITNYIQCKSTPSFYTIDKIAKALNVSSDEFRYFT